MSDEQKLFCPWCKRSDLPLHELKRHVKYCEKAPRPRHKVREKRERRDETNTVDKLFELLEKNDCGEFVASCAAILAWMSGVMCPHHAQKCLMVMHEFIRTELIDDAPTETIQ